MYYIYINNCKDNFDFRIKSILIFNMVLYILFHEIFQITLEIFINLLLELFSKDFVELFCCIRVFINFLLCNEIFRTLEIYIKFFFFYLKCVIIKFYVLLLFL
ncbi:hypothetical protein IMG5_175350 [Ichthyophthirius multifiliis]|uniref:Uncharacterized protein n=1 Tax=Ichthyophthirius multifiliis TaxID=5932 RepID=G0R261_ICHMU|nr:hypothetical protein IMG5_175350 [Ichthyophthirius multifiliis]EGR28441.1 hypothetical protein IMG5_175350 [Ichthyophthirius multifiliis]|eukprot:XP_004029677.1 hypothetical protein IMG5_175350 [Ichthyophthirius multifiliis]